MNVTTVIPFGEDANQKLLESESDQPAPCFSFQRAIAFLFLSLGTVGFVFGSHATFTHSRSWVHIACNEESCIITNTTGLALLDEHTTVEFPRENLYAFRHVRIKGGAVQRAHYRMDRGGRRKRVHEGRHSYVVKFRDNLGHDIVGAMTHYDMGQESARVRAKVAATDLASGRIFEVYERKHYSLIGVASLLCGSMGLILAAMFEVWHNEHGHSKTS